MAEASAQQNPPEKENDTYQRVGLLEYPEELFEKAARSGTSQSRRPSPSATTEQNWIWLGNHFPEQENPASFEHDTAASLKVLLEKGWVEARKITTDSVSGIKDLVGSDGIFKTLAVIDDAIQSCATHVHEIRYGFQKAGLTLVEILEASQRVGKEEATPVGFSQPRTEMPRVIRDMKEGKSMQSIAIDIWNERLERRNGNSNDNKPERPEEEMEAEIIVPKVA